MRVPDGKYEAIARDIQLGEAKTGTGQVAIECEIVEEGDARGERRTWYGYLSDAAAKFTIESMRNAGWIGKTLEDLTMDPNRRFQIVLATEEYQGKDRQKVKYINRLGGLGEAMEPSKAKEFAKRYSSLVGEVDKEIGYKPPAAAAPAPRTSSPAPKSATAPATAPAKPSTPTVKPPF